MKKWDKPEIIAEFTKDELFVNDVFADHTNHNDTYTETYNQTYNQTEGN